MYEEQSIFTVSDGDLEPIPGVSYPIQSVTALRNVLSAGTAHYPVAPRWTKISLICLRNISKGIVNAKMSGNFVSRCKAHTTPFPYDSQHCQLIFRSTLPSYLVLLKRMDVTEEDMRSVFSESSEWKMQNFAVSTNDDPLESPRIPEMENLGMRNSEFRIHFLIVRQPYYYLVLLVVPILMSTILLIIIPLIPMQSGERLGFATNLFLAFVLFLLLVDNMLPKSSFSSLTISMTISVVLVLLNIFETILVNYFYNRISNEVADPSTNVVVPLPVSRMGSPEPVERLQLETHSEEVTIPRKRNRTKMNARVVMQQIDRCFAFLNFLVVIGANLYIAIKLVPSYMQ